MSDEHAISPCFRIGTARTLHVTALDRRQVEAGLMADGLIRGAIDYLRHVAGRRTAYEIIQRIADDLAAEAIQQKG